MASCFFYMFFVPVYIFILLATILIDYFAAIYISKTEDKKRKKRYLVISVISTCLVLFVFKYFDFFNNNFKALAGFVHWNYPIPALKIILPIGLSFHTFQSLSYVIEVYRGNQKPEHHFGIYALYVMFYPQLVAGPIERPQNLLHQFYEVHHFDYDNVVSGLQQMLWGFFKKVVIADRLSMYVNTVYNNYEYHNGTSLFVAAVFFSFQIYCDFSGYSDIAIGSARVMGFELMANFNRPYFSKSVAEFWRRWHISLSSWFNDYLFTPLVLTFREWGKFAVVFAIMATFFISGLWHGAGWTFITFGVLNGIAFVYDFLTKKIRKTLSKAIPVVLYKCTSIVFTFLFITFSFIFFKAGSFHQAFGIIDKILFQRGKLFVADQRDLRYAYCFIPVLLVTEFVQENKFFNKFSLYNNKYAIIRHLTYYSLVIIILLFGVFDQNQFIYFQF